MKRLERLFRDGANCCVPDLGPADNSRRRWVQFIICVLLVASTGAWHRAGAQATDVPQIVAKGLDAYHANGAAAAIDAWLAGSPIAGQPTAKGNTLQSLMNIESLYGHYVGADVLKSINIGPHVRRVYVVLLYDHGPVYAYFECYQSVSGWVIPQLQMHTKASEILPSEMLAQPNT